MTADQKRKKLRRDLRLARQSLSPRQQRVAAENLTRRLCIHPLFIRSGRIGLYLANDGEIDPAGIARAALKYNKKVFLPVLNPVHKGHLLFLPWTPTTPMRKNRFGIMEPDIRQIKPRPAWVPDLVLMPLTGFDSKGNRLGMGGGFYDRSFNFKRHLTHNAPPVLVGLAHECQKVGSIPVASWDVPVHAVFTDKNTYP